MHCAAPCRVADLARGALADAAVQLTKTPMKPNEVARLKALALADAAAAVEMAR